MDAAGQEGMDAAAHEGMDPAGQGGIDPAAPEGMDPAGPDGWGAEGRAGWDAIVADPGRALVALDYDGVLAPIVANPDEAVPAPGAVETLRRLAGRVGTLAVVTGRPAAVVVELGGLDSVPGLRVEGQYGAEHWAAGELTTPEDPPAVVAARAALPDVLAAAGADPGSGSRTSGWRSSCTPAAPPTRTPSWPGWNRPCARSPTASAWSRTPARWSWSCGRRASTRAG